MTTYQVVGQCAHVTVEDMGGSKRSTLLYKGSIVPKSATAKEIEHLLSLRLIAPIDGELMGTHEVGPVAGGDIRTGLDGEQVQSVEPGVGQPLEGDEARKAAEVEKKRADARAKLPEGGAEPDGRASQAVWVEYMVARGGNYADLKDATKADLQKLAEQQK